MMTPFRARTVALALAILACVSRGGAAPAPAVHPIENDCQLCIEKDSSTAGTVKCIEEAQKRWDEELNRLYGKVMKKLPRSAQAAAKAAQLEWIKFRDAEFARIDAMYEKLSGTMYVPMQASEHKDVVRHRAQALKSLLDFLEEHGGSMSEAR